MVVITRVLAVLLFGACASLSRQTASETVTGVLAVVSSRDDPSGDPYSSTEIYLLDVDGTNPRRLTRNPYGDGFPDVAPSGSRIVFDSNRMRSESDPPNTSDLFVMNVDGSGETHLARGSSASWSPDGRRIVFHASASGRGRPIKADPGAATHDSDIFVLDVDSTVAKRTAARNITRRPNAIDDDADWSPDGRRIVFTSHPVSDDPVNAVNAEIYIMNVSGSAAPVALTNNHEEERGPAWSPDGTRIAYMCKRGGADFEICVMNADGSHTIQLTDNAVADLTPSWSPDGTQIVFHRSGPGRFQIWRLKVDGSGETLLTQPPGMNAFVSWGRIRLPRPKR